MQNNITSPAKPRLHHFDMMKGVAIFMVVMGHVLTMCVREIDRATVFKFIGQIHMPLFFFISGWFTFKLADGRVLMPRLGSRAVQLLVPMVVVSSLWIWYFPHSGLQSPLNSTFSGLWSDVWKNGYWFTLVLFEMMLLYAALCPIFTRVKGALGAVAVSLAAWLLLYALYRYCPAGIRNCTSLELVVAFFPAFLFGTLGRRYKESFMKAVHNSWCQTVAMVIFAVTLYVNCWPWEFGLDSDSLIFTGALMHICLAVIMLNVFEKWAAGAFAESASPAARGIARIWEYTGTQSLAIYLLHYFFLFPMGAMRPWLSDVGLSLVPLTAFAAVWAALIVAAVLGVVKILEPSRQLSLLLTGKK